MLERDGKMAIPIPVGIVITIPSRGSGLGLRPSPEKNPVGLRRLDSIPAPGSHKPVPIPKSQEIWFKTKTISYHQFWTKEMKVETQKEIFFTNV